MAKKRTKEPWMSAEDFGRSLPRGIGLNLLVRDMEGELAFCRETLGAMVIDSDEDFAAVELCGSVFMLHADHAYDDHPLGGIARAAEGRGAGIEIRVYGLDPDKTQARAESRGDIVLSGAIEKPHGLRECHIIDPEGYVWVPSRAVSG